MKNRHGEGADFVRSRFRLPTVTGAGHTKLLVEVSAAISLCVGCFDEADQPVRYYHARLCHAGSGESPRAVGG